MLTKNIPIKTTTREGIGFHMLFNRATITVRELTALLAPGGRTIEGPPDGTYWRVEEKKLWELHADRRVWWGLTGNNAPRIKEFLEEAKEGIVPVSWWTHKFAGTNSGAKTHLREMLGGEAFFDTPKPVDLIERVLELATDQDSVVMDAFAGSGTTGHAVLKKNFEDGGKRRFILIETVSDIATEVTSRRLAKAVEGYDSTKREEFRLKEVAVTPRSFASGNTIIEEFESIKRQREADFDAIRIEVEENRIVLLGEKTRSERIRGLGSGVRFCTLGEPLFDADGNVSAAVTFADLAAHVFFCETGSPLPRRADGTSPLIGTFQGRAIYLLHSADAIGVPSSNAGNVLTVALLERLPMPEDGLNGTRVVYAEGCTVPDDRLSRVGVTFKQVPYQIEGI